MRSSQKRFLSFPVMGAMAIVCCWRGRETGDECDDGDDEGKVGMKEGEGETPGSGRGRSQTRVNREAGPSSRLDARPGLLHSPLTH